MIIQNFRILPMKKAGYANLVEKYPMVSSLSAGIVGNLEKAKQQDKWAGEQSVQADR